MADVVGAIYKMSGLPKKGVDAGGNDDGLDLALLAGGAGEDLVAGHFGHGERLSGEGGLVDL